MPSTDLRNYQPVVPPGCEGLVTEEEAARIFADSMDAEEARDRIIALARQRVIEEVERQAADAPFDARVAARLNLFRITESKEPAKGMEYILSILAQRKIEHKRAAEEATLLAEFAVPRKTRGGFGPIVSEPGRFVTDKILMLDTELLPKRTRSLLNRIKTGKSRHGIITQDMIQRVWDSVVGSSWLKPAQLACHLPTKNQACLIGDFPPVGIAAERLAWIHKHVRPSSYAVNVPQDLDAPYRNLVLFFVDQQPAAILAPMRDCWLDMDTYRLLTGGQRSALDPSLRSQ